MDRRLIIRMGSIYFLSCLIVSCSSNTNLSYPLPSATAQGAMIGAAGGAAIGSLAPATGPSVILGGAVAGGALGAAIGNSIQRYQTLQTQMAMHGIQVIEIGDTVKIVIPVDGFYLKNSPQLNPHYTYILDKVAQFIRPIAKSSIKVSGYTDNSESEVRSLALTRQQARSMTTYLWHQGVDARMMYSAGYGSNCPIAHNQLSYGRAQNRRIEISFWRITSDDDR